ncbi:MAG: allophanate hydrolase subunit 1 [Nocardioides sp.]|nr:allophanate hydrolase subunit 1 [Nocardioides sp.]
MTEVSLPGGATLEVRRCGDTGLLIESGDGDVLRSLAGALVAAAIPGITEVVPAMRTVLVVIDPRRTNLGTVRDALRRLTLAEKRTDQAREVHIPVVYDGEDLDFVATHTGLGVAGVIERHQQTQWYVGFCGFAPGFAYLVGDNTQLEVPRRGESRVRVPAGSVALAGTFASVYPRESPGGWQLIGRTDLTLWDVSADPPALLRPGTAVRFTEAS